MHTRSRRGADPFVTLDGSRIRVLVDRLLGGAANQSLAEAELEPGGETRRHYHAETEEIYFVLEGRGEIEVDGKRTTLEPEDAVLIAPGARHQIRAVGGPLRFLCCCAPPYRDEDTFFD